MPAEEEKKKKRKKERKKEKRKGYRIRCIPEVPFGSGDISTHRENYFESKVKRRGWRIFFFWEKQLDRMESLTRFRWFSRFEVKIKKNINEQLEI